MIKKPLAKERVFYRLNERFVSNRTGDIIFFDEDQNTSLAFHKRLADACRNKKFSLKKKITKREQRTIETFINNPLAEDRVFYRLNERFVSNRTGDIIFSTGIFSTLHTNKHFVKRLADACRNTKLFLEEKITKRERRTIETSINNSLSNERVFYRLNERFVSNRTGDIIFSTGIFRTLHTNKHFVKRLADACRNTNLSLQE